MPSPRRFVRRMVRAVVVTAVIGIARDRILQSNRAKYGPEPLDRR